MLAAILLLSAPVEVLPVVQELVEPDPRAMTQKQIREFNAKLDRKHPFYIRCVSTIEIGTLSKRQYSCRTNQKWAQADTTGNDNAREVYGAMTSKSWNQEN